MRVPRLNPSLAIQNLIVVGKITRLGAEKSARRLHVRLASECLYQIEMMRPLQCSRPKSFLNWKRRTATEKAMARHEQDDIQYGWKNPHCDAIRFTPGSQGARHIEGGEKTT
jgi:hypothetical protein